MTEDFDNPRPPRIVPDGVGEPATPPIIRELFKLLPPPGSDWKTYDRVAFLTACAAVFDVTYGKAPTQITCYAERMRELL